MYLLRMRFGKAGCYDNCFRSWKIHARCMTNCLRGFKRRVAIVSVDTPRLLQLNMMCRHASTTVHLEVSLIDRTLCSPSCTRDSTMKFDNTRITRPHLSQPAGTAQERMTSLVIIIVRHIPHDMQLVHEPGADINLIGTKNSFWSQTCCVTHCPSLPVFSCSWFTEV